MLAVTAAAFAAAEIAAVVPAARCRYSSQAVPFLPLHQKAGLASFLLVAAGSWHAAVAGVEFVASVLALPEPSARDSAAFHVLFVAFSGKAAVAALARTCLTPAIAFQTAWLYLVWAAVAAEVACAGVAFASPQCSWGLCATSTGLCWFLAGWLVLHS